MADKPAAAAPAPAAPAAAPAASEPPPEPKNMHLLVIFISDLVVFDGIFYYYIIKTIVYLVFRKIWIKIPLDVSTQN